MWKEGEYIIFQCTVEETGKPCLTGGWVKLAPGSSDPGQDQPISQNNSKSDAIFEAMRQKVSADMVRKVNAIFRWIITNDQKEAISQWGKSGNALKMDRKAESRF